QFDDRYRLKLHAGRTTIGHRAATHNVEAHGDPSSPFFDLHSGWRIAVLSGRFMLFVESLPGLCSRTIHLKFPVAILDRRVADRVVLQCNAVIAAIHNHACSASQCAGNVLNRRRRPGVKFWRSTKCSCKSRSVHGFNPFPIALAIRLPRSLLPERPAENGMRPRFNNSVRWGWAHVAFAAGSVRTWRNSVWRASSKAERS